MCAQIFITHRGMRVGVVSTQSRPPDLRRWLAHHRAVGVHAVYLRWEGDIGHADREVLEDNRDWVSVVEHVDVLPDTPGNVCPRQAQFATRVAGTVAETDWVVHIDDDELLYCPIAPIDSVFESVPPDAVTVRIDNLEAVLEDADAKPVASPFENPRAVLFRRGLAAYGNGKAAAKVGVGNSARSCHWFVGKPVYNMPPRSLLVLHFEALTLADWRRKFSQRLDISASELRHVPFAYYRDSVAVLKRADATAEEEARVFRRYRTAVGHRELGESTLCLRRIAFDAYPQRGPCPAVSIPLESREAPAPPEAAAEKGQSPAAPPRSAWGRLPEASDGQPGTKPATSLSPPGSPTGDAPGATLTMTKTPTYVASPPSPNTRFDNSAELVMTTTTPGLDASHAASPKSSKRSEKLDGSQTSSWPENAHPRLERDHDPEPASLPLHMAYQHRQPDAMLGFAHRSSRMTTKKQQPRSARPRLF